MTSSSRIAVGGGEDAGVGLQFAIGADAREAAILGHPQEFGLQRRGHIGDFIQKNGAVVRLLEAADALRHRAGERAFLVAEQLAFEQCLRDRGAIDLNQRAAARGCSRRE